MEKTYHANPNDHDAVASALLDQYRDQQAGEMKFSVQELRPEVLAFALLMEQRLREKDADKGQSWKNADMNRLRVAAISKAGMLEQSICTWTGPLNVYLSKHSIDLANYAMMIADVAGALDPQAQESAA